MLKWEHKGHNDYIMVHIRGCVDHERCRWSEEKAGDWSEQKARDWSEQKAGDLSWFAASFEPLVQFSPG